MFAPLAWGATNIASVEFINPSHFQDRRGISTNNVDIVRTRCYDQCGLGQIDPDPRLPNQRSYAPFQSQLGPSAIRFILCG